MGRTSKSVPFLLLDNCDKTYQLSRHVTAEAPQAQLVALGSLKIKQTSKVMSKLQRLGDIAAHTFVFDKLFDTVCDVEPAIFVDFPNISCAKPSVFDKSLLRGIWPIMVLNKSICHQYSCTTSLFAVRYLRLS